MKFDKFSCMYDFYWIHLLPTIELVFNEQIYCKENFSIRVHWLFWHVCWRWLKEEQACRDK